MQVPIILGVDGEARDLFIRQGEVGVYFEPENVNELARVIRDIVKDTEKSRKLKENARNYVAEKFNRNKIAKELSATLNQIKVLPA